jgi:hypothetical protein
MEVDMKVRTQGLKIEKRRHRLSTNYQEESTAMNVNEMSTSMKTLTSKNDQRPLIEISSSPQRSIYLPTIILFTALILHRLNIAVGFGLLPAAAASIVTKELMPPQRRTSELWGRRLMERAGAVILIYDMTDKLKSSKRHAKSCLLRLQHRITMNPDKCLWSKMIIVD